MRLSAPTLACFFTWEDTREWILTLYWLKPRGWFLASYCHILKMQICLFFSTSWVLSSSMTVANKFIEEFCWQEEMEGLENRSSMLVLKNPLPLVS